MHRPINSSSFLNFHKKTRNQTTYTVTSAKHCNNSRAKALKILQTPPCADQSNHSPLLSPCQHTAYRHEKAPSLIQTI